MILFTKHANDKFGILKRHKFSIAKQHIIDALQNPDNIDHLRAPLLIVQKKIDKDHVVRVVYKHEGDDIKVITFYPSSIERYEK